MTLSLIGPPIYEWISHNFFVIAMIIGSLAVVGYFLYQATKQKGSSR